MAKTIVILGTLDSKGESILYLKEKIEEQGCEALIIDLSTREKSSLRGDITCEEVAKAGGSDIQELRASIERYKINSIMINGAIQKAEELHAAGRMDGIITIGGASNGITGSSIMKALPLGLPKFILDDLAGWDDLARRCISGKDIAIMNSIANISERPNIITKDALSRAAGAICGMAKASSPSPVLDTEEPLIALTEGNFHKSVGVIRDYFEQRGYQVIPFHGVGNGDNAMEKLIEQGFFKGVIDLSPGAISDELIEHSLWNAIPTRLEAAGKRGIPQIVAPGCIDFLSPATPKLKAEYDNRKKIVYDDMRTLVRISAEEIAIVADRVAEKLNKARGPVKFLIPLGGWCVRSYKGGPLSDPECDRVFIERLKQKLKPEIEVKEIDAWINDPEFGLEVATTLDEMFKSYQLHRNP